MNSSIFDENDCYDELSKFFKFKLCFNCGSSSYLLEYGDFNWICEKCVILFSDYDSEDEYYESGGDDSSDQESE